MTVHIITYATHDERYFPALMWSGQGAIRVLGIGQKWHGFHSKAVAVREFCGTVDPSDIIFYVDGFDCVILSPDPRREIEEKFKRRRCKILFATESFEMPLVTAQRYAQQRIWGTCRGTHISAGMYVGRAQHVGELWRDIEASGLDDDQVYAARLCRERPVNFEVDSRRDMFYNMTNGRSIVAMQGGRLYVLGAQGSAHETHVGCPIAMQAPGAHDMSAVLQSLGFPGCTVRFKGRTVSMSPEFVRTYWKYFMTEICIFALTIVSLLVLAYLYYFVR